MLLFRKINSIWEIFVLALRGGEANILSGNINRAILLLAIPMMLEMLMESLFAVVDIFFVSKIGVNAIAVVGLTESMLTIVYSIAWGLAMGTTALVARRVGEQDNNGAAVSAMQAIYIAVIIAVPIGIAGFFFSEDLLRLMGASEVVINEGKLFTQIVLSANIIIMLLFLINGIFRGAGDATIAMRSLWIANVINIILDPLFIFGIAFFPEMGVAGAAVATTIGRGSGIIYQVYHLLKGKGIIKLNRSSRKFNKEIINNLIKLSSGVTGQFIIASASWIFLMRIMSTFGSNALAGYTIAIRIVVFTILPAWGISNAAATMVGQNLGANQLERAEKSVWRTGLLNMSFMGFVMIIFLSFAEPIIKFFTDVEPVIKYAKTCLNIMAMGYLSYALGMVIMQAFNGAGDTRTPTIMNFFIFWLLQIPLAYILSIKFNLGPTGLFWSIVIAETAFTLSGYFLFKKGRWKTIKI